MNQLDRNIFLSTRDLQGAVALFHAFGLVPNAVVGGQQPGINPEIGLLAHKRIGSRFPYISRDGTAVDGG